jgi:hypothetical protein
LSGRRHLSLFVTQDLWSCLPFVLSHAVETDPTTVAEVRDWLASHSSGAPAGGIAGRRRSGPSSAASGIVGAAVADGGIIGLMDAAPLFTNELLSVDRHILSLRERARVTNRVRSVPYVAGRFFSEAWLFHTWSGDSVAAVLTGLSVGAGQWRGRLEFRCNDGETFERYIQCDKAAGRFIAFLTNGIFRRSGPQARDAFLADPTASVGGVGPGGMTSIEDAAALHKWQGIAASRKILGLAVE